MSALERVWYGRSGAARLTRAVLAPAELLYAAGSSLRSALYDGEWLSVVEPALPVLAVGNVSVGGTGKTPVTAWAVSRLRASGARPAVVMRGYGGDEPLVHEALNPGVAVIADADRVRGVRAARDAGADCVVLDDAFQHRRIGRTADWVLVAAERFESTRHLLPRGPLREPMRAIARASIAIVTRKTAPASHASEIADALSSRHGVSSAVITLVPSGVVDAHAGTSRPLSALRGVRLAAAAAVGAPDAFFTQIEEAGALLLHRTSFGDHHAFTGDDVRRILRDAHGADAVACTLKDVVKLAPLWPRNSVPLWYVSQRVQPERGGAALDASLASVLAARASIPSTAGAAG